MNDFILNKLGFLSFKFICLVSNSFFPFLNTIKVVGVFS